MSIYKHSRYTETSAFYSGGTVLTFNRRKRLNFSNAKGVYYTWGEYDTTDTIAYNNYGSSKLWWVILDANPQYQTELDIKVGDTVFIPDRMEVSNVYG
jgi:hypothetical protein